MKEKILLICFGAILGLAVLAIAYPFLPLGTKRLPEGAVFSSVEDLHASLVARDERDIKEDRSVSLRSIIAPHSSERIMYDLLPNLAVKFQGVSLRTNSCGFRGPERSIERIADNVYRIALLGDSFAFGWGVEYEESFAQVLEQTLNELLQGRLRVEVLNLGVPGYSTFQEVALFKDRGLAFRPDAVLVYFVSNDVQPPFYITDLRSQGGLIDSVKFSRRFWAKEEEATKQHNQLAALLDPNRMLKQLHQLLLPYGAELFVAVNPGRNWKADRRMLTYARSKHGVHMLPLADDLTRVVSALGIPKEKLRLPNDPHPSAPKHRLIGEVLAAAMLPVVERSWRICSNRTLE